MMAADSDGYSSVTTVVTCEGDLTDPTFPGKLECVIDSLQDLLGGKWHIRKLEPWNSVRVTLSIPREAALRLRHLASEGSQQLRALGILSVQVEGDQVISLRLAGPEPQEIILRTTQQDEASTSTSGGDGGLSRIIGEAHVSSVVSPSEKIQFRSPNVVCPTDTVVPKVPSQSIPSSSTVPIARTYTGPFPFTSMNQAIHNRETLPYSTPPPPYPGKHPPITISSPLLVNLLQNDGGNQKSTKVDSESVSAPNNNGPDVHSNGAVTSGSTFKYSTTSLCTQATPSLKAPVTTPATFVKNITIPAIKTNCIITPTASSLSTVANVSNLPTPSTNQCNSTDNSLNNTLSSALSSATARLYTSLSKPSTSSVQKSLMEGFSQVNSNIRPQCRFTSSLPISTLSAVAASSSNNLNLSVTPTSNRNSTIVRTFRPFPPTYSSHFEPIAQPMPQLLDLTPSLTELKVTDLDHLLPTLQNELVRSPPNLPEELTNATITSSTNHNNNNNNVNNASDRCNYLINPLTGELEPHISSDSDNEQPSDIFTGLPSPAVTTDDDTNSMSRPDTTDQSDSESRSTHSDSSKNSKIIKSVRIRGGEKDETIKQEKIKLRLKLEKSEPVNSAYKVDVSFINMSVAKKTPSVGEELRVPPLHISLRGRNHAVINNRKKIKINSSDNSASKGKIRKIQQENNIKIKKSSSSLSSASSILKESLMVSEQSAAVEGGAGVSALTIVDYAKESASSSSSEQKKAKKLKTNLNEHKDSLMPGDTFPDLTKQAYNNVHFKERRGSDSELAQTAKRYAESNGILRADKKRRLSHTELDNNKSHLFVLGSTNTGTVTALPTQKSRKEKIKCKELNRNKSYAKNVADKLIIKQTTGFSSEKIDGEMKYKRLLEDNTEKGVPRPPHRTENHQYEQPEKEVDNLASDSSSQIKDKPPELPKNDGDHQKSDLSEKQSSRSPNSGGQGEDSGIESMDALSEKSPNQASQSPHTDISDTMKSKPQESRILDIEAQLAKMEGLNGEDMNENKRGTNPNIEQCCGLTSALQDSLKQGTVSLTTHVASPMIKEQLPQVEVSLVPLKAPSEDVLEPQPVRISPARYTYSNPDKGRGSESSSMSDSDSNSCSLLIKNKSLLEQLLIEIPDNQNPSSPSPMTRSLRTRASSKLSSPELNSPIPSKQPRMNVPKRKRRESDSSNNSLEDARNKKPRKCSENAAELIKVCMGVESAKANVRKTKLVDDSSDSDEPLIEVAGKVRKNNINSARAKFKCASYVGAPVQPAAVKTRSSVRTMPALNTRSKGDKVQSNTNSLRRKTRSSVSEGEGKRRKDVK